MHSRVVGTGVFLAVCTIALSARRLEPQGLATSAIRGVVRSSDGAYVDGTIVRITNRATGYGADVRVTDGMFIARGLAVGGPYTVEIRRVGYAPQELNGIVLALGETRAVSLTLFAGVWLDTVRSTASSDRYLRWPGGGIGASFADSDLQGLPTLNRDLFDFVRLVPQVGTRFGVSGAGASVRLNAFVIDGVSDRSLQGNGVLGGPTGGKAISLDAVSEYQVLVSPYDPRYGDFTGLLVNAVTKHGTNDWHGTAYGYERNARFASRNSFVGAGPFERRQYGFSLGGPIVRDHVHFFIAPEFQYASAPAAGPYLGQPSDSDPHVPVTEAEVTRFSELLRARGITAGDAGRVTNSNPNAMWFGRVDAVLPALRSRLVVRHSYTTVDAPQFARPQTTLAFPLSSVAYALRMSKQTVIVQLYSQRSATSNEFVVAYTDAPILAIPFADAPSIQATVPVAPSAGSGTATITAGPPPTGQGSGASQRSIEAADHLIVQLGPRHTIGFGVRGEFFHYHANTNSVGGAFGQWRFSSLDSLDRGAASFYSIGRDFGGATNVVRGVQPGVYISDEFRAGAKLSAMFGLRADALVLSGGPAYNEAVELIFHRRTSDFPSPRVQWSPRLGVDWQPFGSALTRVHGGAGIFTGRPPLGWLLNPMRLNGAGVKTLTCSTPGTIPAFVADVARQPQTCNGAGLTDGPVGLVDRDLRLAQSLRASVSIDQPFASSMVAGIDVMYSGIRSDFAFVNAQLNGPQGVDVNGRVLYGTIAASGRATPAYVDGGRFRDVIDVRNVGRGSSVSITGRAERRVSDGAEVRASYTYSRTRDVQSLTSPSVVSAANIWAAARFVSGRQDDQSVGISSYDIPHRIVVVATYRAPWKHWRTDAAVYYIGESGTPFTFGDSSANGLGDLNADGTSANDPIYIPRDATNPAEMVFAGRDSVEQARAFERFVADTPCLSHQRGQIMARNSCRARWVHTSNAAVQQGLPLWRGHDATLRVDVFNVLNLVNPRWGNFWVPNTAILQQVRETTGANPQPVFNFVFANTAPSRQNAESGYQLQLSVRYSF